MNRIKLFTFLFLLVSVTVFGQDWNQSLGQLPTNGLRHQFKFDNVSDLEAPESGLEDVSLVRAARPTFTETFNAVAGYTAGDGAVSIELGSYYELSHNFDVNGPDNPTRVNVYTLVMDIMLPDNGPWHGLHAGDNNADPEHNDWESFIRPGGRIGVGSTGYADYNMPSAVWHRVVMVCDLPNSFRYYIDGQLVQDGGEQSLDGRFSLSSIDDANIVLLFGDNDGEDAEIHVSEFAMYDRALTDEEIWGMGGFGNSTVLGSPMGTWLFDNPSDLAEAYVGEDLHIVGTPQSVSGPTSTDYAVEVGVGSHFISYFGVAPDSGAEFRNNYSLVMDVKLDNFNNKVALLQTDPSNSNDADLWINTDGKVGNDEIGYTDSSLVAGAWNRIVITSAAGESYKIFFEGDSMMDAGALDLDGRLAINSTNDSGKVYFFADNDGEDNTLQVAQISWYNRPLSANEVEGIGGYYHGPPNNEVTGSGRAVYFNGNEFENKYARIEKTDNLKFGKSNWTIELWVKPDVSYPSDPCIISDKDWDDGNNTGWVLSMRGDDWKYNVADDSLDAEGSVDEFDRFDVEAPNISDGNWHHIVVVTDQDSGVRLITDDLVQAYSDGDGSFFSLQGKIDNDMPICIAQDGTENYGDAPAPLVVDEVRIWKGVALDVATLKEWRSKEVTDDHPNRDSLVLYLKFDEVEGDTVYDHSGYGHDAQLMNAPRREISYAAIATNGITETEDMQAVWGGNIDAVSGGLAVSADFPTVSAHADLNTKSVLFDDPVANPYSIFGYTSDALMNSKFVIERATRVWEFYSTEATPVDASFQFVFSQMGGSGSAGEAFNYVLLHSDGSGFDSLSVESVSASGDTVTFEGVANIESGYYTIGTLNGSASPLGGIATGVEGNEVVPNEFALSNNYPNPFNPSTQIEFALPAAARVELVIYNVLGQKVDQVINNTLNAGYHNVVWNAGNFASGVYVYQMTATSADGKSFQAAKKMLLVK